MIGLTSLEAAASRTPSLASRCGGTTDAVAQGRSGFFADDETPEGIAQGLTRFFTGQLSFDPAAVHAHAQAHTWPTVLRQIEDTYGRLCHSRR